MWTCPKCGELIEDQFRACWKCAGSVAPPVPMPVRKPSLQLELIALMIAAAPGLLWIANGRARNSGQAAFRIGLFVLGVIAFVAIVAIRSWQRRKPRGPK